MLTREIIKALLGIFLLIIPGYLFRRAKIFTEDQSRGLSAIVVNVSWPCLIISSMQLSYDAKYLADAERIGVSIVVITAAVALLAVLAAALLGYPRSKKLVLTFMLLFGNTGFIGIPVIRALYGAEGLFYAAIYEAIDTIILFTAGVFLIQSSAGDRLRVRAKDFLSPIIIGILIGLALFVSRITLPDLVRTVITSLGNITTPLAMFVIGFQIAGLSAKELFGDGKSYASIAVKLIAVPFIAYLCVLLVNRLFGVSGPLDLPSKVTVLEFAMPIAAASGILTQQYRTEEAFAAKAVLLSTVFSLLSISVTAILLEL
jgi:predicted permease